jgi:predicted oxidoreductase
LITQPKEPSDGLEPSTPSCPGRGSASSAVVQIAARDPQLRNPFTKDSQIMAIRNARRYIGDRLSRTAPPHAILDPANGPLVAVKLHVLTRKTPGGIQTDLHRAPSTARALRSTASSPRAK